mmetsp:Transcript_21462/g.76384  ORF Transcript_21462/g.76384 Transcript_21462/m.76384 type:complete len:262 (+) Transcript_21462:6277-7062(+)
MLRVVAGQALRRRQRRVAALVAWRTVDAKRPVARRSEAHSARRARHRRPDGVRAVGALCRRQARVRACRARGAGFAVVRAGAGYATARAGLAYAGAVVCKRAVCTERGLLGRVVALVAARALVAADAARGVARRAAQSALGAVRRVARARRARGADRRRFGDVDAVVAGGAEDAVLPRRERKRAVAALERRVTGRRAEVPRRAGRTQRRVAQRVRARRARGRRDRALRAGGARRAFDAARLRLQRLVPARGARGTLRCRAR